MKRIMAVLVIIVLFISSISVYSANDQISLYINGAKLAFDKDAAPFIDNGRTLIPIRKVAEALYAKVDWDSSTRTVSVVKGTKTIRLIIDDVQAMVNDQAVTLDVPAKIKSNRTYVPFRFVSEYLGATVEWDAKTKSIKLVCPNISVAFDKTKAKAGEIIKATISASGFENIAGYQFNLKYDPKVLAPVKADGKPYIESTSPEKGNIIINEDYSVFPIATNDLEEGIINTGRSYLDVLSYRNSGKPEKSGSLAVISFLVLESTPTEIKFIDTTSMPSAVDGFTVFDWNAKPINGIMVVQPQKIN
jgi:hypothetical protein